MSMETALEEFANEVEKAADVSERWAGATPSDRAREDIDKLRAWVKDVRYVLAWFYGDGPGDDLFDKGLLINLYGER